MYPQLVHDRRFNLVAQDVTHLASGKSAIMENGGGTKDGIVSNGNALLDNVPLISNLNLVPRNYRGVKCCLS